MGVNPPGFAVFYRAGSELFFLPVFCWHLASGFLFRQPTECLSPTEMNQRAGFIGQQ
jgi:hypothetical protein